jgi:hypothetical protein
LFGGGWLLGSRIDRLNERRASTSSVVYEQQFMTSNADFVTVKERRRLRPQPDPIYEYLGIRVRPANRHLTVWQTLKDRTFRLHVFPSQRNLIQSVEADSHLTRRNGMAATIDLKVRHSVDPLSAVLTAKVTLGPRGLQLNS